MILHMVAQTEERASATLSPRNTSDELGTVGGVFVAFVSPSEVLLSYPLARPTAALAAFKHPATPLRLAD